MAITRKNLKGHERFNSPTPVINVYKSRDRGGAFVLHLLDTTAAGIFGFPIS